MGILSKLLGGRREEPAAIYTRMRNEVLALAQEAGGPPGAPIAALMETGMRGAVYTLLAHTDGTASLYFSNGGGVIGGGSHRRCAEAARAFLDLARQHRYALTPTDDAPLPASGWTRFSLIESGGVRSAEFKERLLAADRAMLSPLFHRGHELIAVIRHVSQIREGEDPLIVAIFDESPDALKALLGEGADPDTRTSGGTPALAAAAGTAQPELVGLLLAGGARVDAADGSGLSALMAAAHAGAERALVRLLTASPDLEQRDESGYTALMFAANACQAGCTRRLLEAGADAEALDADRSTPIMFAAQHGADDVVRLLLEAGADPLQEGEHGHSAVGFAEQNGHVSTLQLMLG
ncbi:MAG: ankyrin repeat domain-containing protein [Myxococcota bacterium]